MRFDPDQVALMIRDIASELQVVEIESRQCFEAFDQAKKKGVRGGRIYDYLHACAAIHHSCDMVYTLNAFDFEGLFEELEILAP